MEQTVVLEPRVHLVIVVPRVVLVRLVQMVVLVLVALMVQAAHPVHLVHQERLVVMV